MLIQKFTCFNNIYLTFTNKKFLNVNKLKNFSTNINNDFSSNKMFAWFIHNHDGNLIKKRVSIPQLTNDNQILIKVKAASINPIDIKMSYGYGHKILSKWRQLELINWNFAKYFCQKDFNNHSCLIIPGRDCSGEVVKVGSKVTKINPGDEVIAVIPGSSQGTHAEYVVANKDCIVLKPKLVNHVEACALAFTACTSWIALVDIAKINLKNAKNVRVLIHGGSGGMGTTAIQLLHAWGSSKIVATCSKPNMDYVKKLGAIPINYDLLESKQQIIDEGPYEIILDCVNSTLSQWSKQVLGVWRNCSYVSLVSPLLNDTDRYGIPLGMLTTFFKYLSHSVQLASEGKWYLYAFSKPNSECLSQLATLIDEKKIVPHVETIFGFNEIGTVYSNYRKLPQKGKVVIDFNI